jgi:hypothetical protein
VSPHKNAVPNFLQNGGHLLVSCLSHCCSSKSNSRSPYPPLSPFTTLLLLWQSRSRPANPNASSHPRHLCSFDTSAIPFFSRRLVLALLSSSRSSRPLALCSCSKAQLLVGTQDSIGHMIRDLTRSWGSGMDPVDPLSIGVYISS